MIVRNDNSIQRMMMNSISMLSHLTIFILLTSYFTQEANYLFETREIRRLLNVPKIDFNEVKTRLNQYSGVIICTFSLFIRYASWIGLSILSVL